MTFPELKVDKVLWYSDYWDGPLSGMLTVAGENYWFKCYDEDVHTRARKHYIYRLTDQQLAFEFEWHKRFEKYVGTRWNMVDGRRGIGEVKPQAEHSKFYEPYKKVKHLSADNVVKEDQILGWCYL